MENKLNLFCCQICKDQELPKWYLDDNIIFDNDLDIFICRNHADMLYSNLGLEENGGDK